MNKDVLKFKKLSGLITESQYKKLLKENEVLNSPAVQTLEKKAFEFFNSPKVVDMVKRAIKVPEQPIQENQMQVDGFQSFNNLFDKAMQNQTMEENEDISHNNGVEKNIAQFVGALAGTSIGGLSAQVVDGSMLRNVISAFYDYMPDSVVNSIDPNLGNVQGIMNGLITAGVAYALFKKMNK